MINIIAVCVVPFINLLLLVLLVHDLMSSQSVKLPFTLSTDGYNKSYNPPKNNDKVFITFLKIIRNNEKRPPIWTVLTQG
jgi:hypothetical protein